MNVLALQRRRLGDILMTTPALRAFKARFPKARITFLCDSALISLLESGGLVEELVPLDPDASARARLRMLSDLRRRTFDLVLDFEGSPFTSLLAAGSGARRRIGFRRGFRGLAYTDRVEPDAGAFAGAEKLGLLGPLGIDLRGVSPRPVLEVTPGAREWAQRTFEAAGVAPSQLLLTLAPGARAAEHCWPLERFAELLDRLAATHAFAVIVFPWSWDRMLGAELARLTRVPLFQLDILPSLPQVAAILDRADLHVGNENASKHMAAALGTATLTMYAAGMRRRWGLPGDPLQAALEAPALAADTGGASRRGTPRDTGEGAAEMAAIRGEDAHAAVLALEPYLPRLVASRGERPEAPAPRHVRPRHGGAPPRGRAARSGGA